MASSVEFHPQCVTKAPVDGCRSTSTCGTHGPTTSPRSLVRSMNPSGTNAPGFSPAGVRTAHKNRCPDMSKPTAISRSCSGGCVPLLPKQRNTTLRSGCASSHARHACLSDTELVCPAGDAPRVPQRLHGRALERLERVDEDAAGGVPRVAAPDVHHGLAHLVLLRVLEELPDEMGRRERTDAEELERRVAELLEPRASSGEQLLDLGHDGESGGAGGEEGVDGDAQLGADVDGVGGEHADDQGVDAVARDGAEEEALQLAVVAAQRLEREEERGLVAGVGEWSVDFP
nr:unnamed protein product [Digitaria exilis]